MVCDLSSDWQAFTKCKSVICSDKTKVMFDHGRLNVIENVFLAIILKLHIKTIAFLSKKLTNQVHIQ